MRSSSLILVASFVIFISSCNREQNARFVEASQLTGGGNAKAGVVAIGKYGCGRCHTIQGVQGAVGLVGPPLDRFAYRIYIAGQFPNTAENLTHWIQQPQEMIPHNAMPDMGVTDKDSRDIAAYLYTLR